MQRSSNILIVISLITIALTSNAHAYIDPGSGSLIVQMLLAAVVGAAFYFRKAFQSLCSLFRRNKNNDRHDNTN